MMIGTRKELVTTPAGLLQGGVFDIGVQLPHLPYMFSYGEEAMGNLYTSAPNGKPTFRWALRTSFPIIGSFTKITK